MLVGSFWMPMLGTMLQAGKAVPNYQQLSALLSCRQRGKYLPTRAFVDSRLA